ncbi:hypothetical protein N752_24835 [Desulforamulus aquiferis]|nr:hypothetical protein N752_24835 [Desulforamulus aquiferis]
MKTNKALLSFNGKPMLEVIISKLRPHFEEILISSNNPQQYKYLGLPIFTDYYQNRGPLAGIHSGLKNITNDSAFFVACDMPFLNTQLANLLLARLDGKFDISVPQRDRYLQPLHAAYSKRCLPAIEQSLQSERPRITSFYEQVHVRYFDFNKHPEFNWNTIFFNVNTPEDYQQAQNVSV